MVSFAAFLCMALGVAALYRSLPSPLKQIVLVSFPGVLISSAVAEAAGKERGPGPPPPLGWRWFQVAGADGASATAGAPGASLEGEGLLPEVISFEGWGSARKAEELPAIVLVPGNPGIPHFYCEFGELLHEEFLAAGAGPVAVYVVGYPNFVTSAAGATAREAAGVNSVADEAASMGVVLAALRRRHARRGVVLLGHSIGAFTTTQHLLLEHAAPRGELAGMGRVALHVMAMPYVEMSGWRQGLGAAVFGLPFFKSFARCVSLLLVQLPEQVKRAAIRVAGVAVQQQQDAVLLTFGQQPHHLVGAALLVMSEWARLNPALHEGAGFEELRSLLQAPGRPPVLALYTADDHWGPEAHADRLRTMLAETDELVDLTSEQSTVISGVPPPHSFPMSPGHWRPLAQLIASRAAARLASEG